MPWPKSSPLHRIDATHRTGGVYAADDRRRMVMSRRSRRRLRSIAAGGVLAVAILGALPTPARNNLAASPYLVRIDAGGGSNSRARWAADRFHVGGYARRGPARDIGGTSDDGAYRTRREGMSGYAVPVPRKGRYLVRLHFAETELQARGARVFDVAAEGSQVVDDLDVLAAAGYGAAHTVGFWTQLGDHVLNLDFTPVSGQPMVAAIEIAEDLSVTTTTAAPITTTTSTTTTTTTTPPTSAAPPATAPPNTLPPVVDGPSIPPGGPFSDASFPGPANTGVPAGTVMQVTGSITTAADGQVLEGLDVVGSIRVDHDNVTIRRTRVRQPGGQAITMNPLKRNLVIEDCELDGTGNPSADAAVGDSNFTMRRCNVHHFGEGPRISGNNTIEDSWFHGFLDFVAVGAHQDGLQSTGGSNLIVRHNTIDIGVDGANAVIFLGTYGGDNVLIERNLLAGGGYSVTGGDDLYSNVRILNNRFSTRYFPRCGFHGPLAWATKATVQGNVFHESGQPI